MSSLQRRRVSSRENDRNSGDRYRLKSSSLDSVVYHIDQDRNDDNEIATPLTLMDEVIILAIDAQEGYVTFWDETLSYALRGCILMELALRRRIRVMNAIKHYKTPLSRQHLEVLDPSKTGEPLLDETLELIVQDNKSRPINEWIELLNGETWDLQKLSYQLKQVRERTAKGLVDKGVLRTESKNYLLFDRTIHPISNLKCKDLIRHRIFSILVDRYIDMDNIRSHSDTLRPRLLRTVMLLCGLFSANVLENLILTLDESLQRKAMYRAQEILINFARPHIKNDASGIDISINLSTELYKEVKSMQGFESHYEVLVGVSQCLASMSSLITDTD